jgi:hypothetical protein
MRRAHRLHETGPSRSTEELVQRNRRIILVVLLALLALLFFQLRNRRKEEVFARIDRVNAAFVEVSSALNRYRIDQGVYPEGRPGLYSADAFWSLTTPHPYLWDWKNVIDAFGGKPLGCLIPDTTPPMFVLISTGPDRKSDFQDLQDSPRIGRADLLDRVAALQYDPSNGITSQGDLLWVGE